MLRRTHIYRKSKSVIEIYNNTGGAWFFSLLKEYRKRIPIVSLENKYSRGNYNTEFYRVRIDRNTQKQEEFYRNMTGLYQFFADSSLELLSENVNPWELSASFKDQIRKGDFLFGKIKCSKEKLPSP